MTLPFGISIGDFIAVGDLVRRIAKALDESRGSTVEYKSLCQLLFSLDRSLQVASSIFLYSSSSTGSSFNIHTSSLNGIRYELDCCKRLMEEFLASSKKYTETLLNGRGSRFKNEWRKITWYLYKAEDVQKLQNSLQGHISAFDLYTSAIIGKNVARTEQKVIECADIGHGVEQKVVEIYETTRRTEENILGISVTSQRTESMMENMFSLLALVQQDIPQMMGYTWEGGSMPKPVRLEDALGRIVDLPLMLCIDQNSFHAMLEIMFKNCPGQRKIAQKEYVITDDSGVTIKSSEWESKLLPGSRIEMGIIITKTTGLSNNKSVNRCPRCNAANVGVLPVKGSLKCCQCQLTFQTFDGKRISELPDESDTPTPQKNTKEEGGEYTEYSFRRIHYFLSGGDLANMEKRKRLQREVDKLRRKYEGRKCMKFDYSAIHEALQGEAMKIPLAPPRQGPRGKTVRPPLSPPSQALRREASGSRGLH